MYIYIETARKICSIKLFGISFQLIDATMPPLFSERNGYIKWHYIGKLKWRFSK